MRLLAENVSLWKGLIQDQRDWDSSPEPSTLLQLPTITAPVLVIVGAEDTPDLRAIADSLRIRIPNARQVVLEGADHFPGLEQPGRVRELIAQFLR